MTTRSCIIVDDEPMAIKVLESHFGQLPSWQVMRTFTSASAAADFLQREQPDVLLLDIQMPGLNGLKLLRTLPNEVPTILTTAHREFALEGYELNVVDYLMKPIGLDRLLSSLAKLPNPAPTWRPIPSEAELAEPIPSYIYLKSDRQYIKVSLADIYYVEALRNYLCVHSKEGSYTTLLPLMELEEKLPATDFVRCHRSFIVALHQIERFDHANLFIQGERIPIGRSYRQQVLAQLNRYTL